MDNMCDIKKFAMVPRSSFCLVAMDPAYGMGRVVDIRARNEKTLFQHPKNDRVFGPIKFRDGTTFATADRDQYVALWDLRHLSRPCQQHYGKEGRVTALNYINTRTDGQVLAASEENVGIFFRSQTPGVKSRSFNFMGMLECKTTPDGSKMVISMKDSDWFFILHDFNWRNLCNDDILFDFLNQFPDSWLSLSHPVSDDNSKWCQGHKNIFTRRNNRLEVRKVPKCNIEAKEIVSLNISQSGRLLAVTVKYYCGMGAVRTFIYDIQDKFTARLMQYMNVLPMEPKTRAPFILSKTFGCNEVIDSYAQMFVNNRFDGCFCNTESFYMATFSRGIQIFHLNYRREYGHQHDGILPFETKMVSMIRAHDVCVSMTECSPHDIMCGSRKGTFFTTGEIVNQNEKDGTFSFKMIFE